MRTIAVTQLLVVAPLAVSLATPAAAQSLVAPGFTLFSPTPSTPTYLIDDSGTILHTWPSAYRPACAAYLHPNGNVIRNKDQTFSPLGCASGGVEEIAWDGTVVWSFDYMSGGVLSHHDLEVLPNGNILIQAYEDKTRNEAIAQGRNPATVTTPFRPVHIIEVQPTPPFGGNIVWEWHVWDHLVQEFDPTKANYGQISANAQLVDLNYPPGPEPNGDWLHTNTVKYSPVLDQIVLSPHNFNEFWIIDHSTTTAESASHAGGNQGMGGDILYRWGNPEAYKSAPASAEILNGQHDPNWVPEGYPGEGNIIVFNNNAGGTFFGMWSSVMEIDTTVDATGGYPQPAPGTPHGPAAAAWEYTAPNPQDFYSPFISGAHRLENGNTLVCSGNQGWLFEVDQAGNKVWEYNNVLPGVLNNGIFKVRRYQRTFFPNGDQVSVSGGGTANLELLAGTAHAGRGFLVLGSASGTSPGFVFEGQTVALNVDTYFNYTVGAPNSPLLSNSFGTLDALGAATTTFNLPAGSDPSLVGVQLNHVFGVLDLASGTIPHVSNPLPLDLVP